MGINIKKLVLIGAVVILASSLAAIFYQSYKFGSKAQLEARGATQPSAKISYELVLPKAEEGAWCADAFDNDRDGLIDCEDPDCINYSACKNEK